MSRLFRRSCIYSFDRIKNGSLFSGVNFTQLNTVMSDTGAISTKRPLEDVDNSNKRHCVENPLDEHVKVDKIKRRKVVMLLGYCGQGYLGMQRNIGFKTIEEDLVTALLKADLIKKEEFNQIQNLQFQRAARTDKGVSAVRQVVSLKLPENATVEVINQNLPPAIRVFAIRRVTKGFNSKSSCNARTYSYMTPTSAFGNTEDPESYRITPEIIDKIKSALQVFVGTHNFHNFTAKKKPQDPSAHRYIISFECGDPFVREKNEFIVLQVKGQSFMLHQIRKMVGTVVGIVRGLTTAQTISKAWNEPRFDLPIAPGLGLVLEQVHYDRYNAKYGADGMHQSLNWDEYEEQIQAFKENFIEPIIVQTELAEKSMNTWVQTLSYHTFDIRQVHLHATNANGQLQISDTDAGSGSPEQIVGNKTINDCTTQNPPISEVNPDQ